MSDISMDKRVIDSSIQVNKMAIRKKNRKMGIELSMLAN